MGKDVGKVVGAAAVVADGAEVAGTPGKRALTDRLRAPPSELPEVIARAGATFEHMHYQWAVLPDGAFELRARPKDTGPEAGRIGARVAPASQGWQALALKALTLPATATARVPNSPLASTPTDIAGAPTWWPADVATPEVATPAPAASWADTLRAPVDDVIARARGLFADAKALVAAHTSAPAPTAGPPGAAPAIPPPTTLPAPRAAAATAITGGSAPRPPAAPKAPAPQGTDLRLARPSMPGASTLDIASSRLHLGVETDYHLPGSAFSSAEKQDTADLGALRSTFKVINDQVQALTKVIGPAPKEGGPAKRAPDPARIAEAEQTRAMLMPAWTLLKDLIDQRVAADTAHTQSELEALRTGDVNASEFWCSGLSFWTLAAAGYNPSAELRGTDGHAFSFTYTDVTGKSPREVSGKVTLKKLIDGEPEAVEAMILIERSGQTTGNPPVKLTADGTGKKGGHRGGYDADGTVSGAVKGAAYAFEKFGIGVEVPAASQKPGDFAQARWKTAGKTTDLKLDHVGRGHAWQVSAVECIGSAMFGASGSPRLVKGTSPTTPTWLANQAFVIDGHTDPRLVGAHTVTSARRLEANTPDAMGGEAKAGDKHDDGGVQETRSLPLATSNDDKHPDYHVFYGRLNDSVWSAGRWTEATAATARALVASGAAGAIATLSAAPTAPGPEAAATPAAPAAPAPAPAPDPTATTAAPPAVPPPAPAVPAGLTPAGPSGDDAEPRGGGLRGHLLPLP